MAGATQEELAAKPAKNTLQILKELGFIVPWTIIASISNGMSGPIGIYLTLNFFAQRYTDLPPEEMQCHLDMVPVHCQRALIDGNKLMTVMAVLTPICQLITLPMVGVLSDAFGRRKALLCVYLLSSSALLFCDLFVFFNFSYWFAIAVTPFMNEQVVSTVLQSCCVDILPAKDRAAGMGIVTALDTVAYVVGLALGLGMGSLKMTFTVASGIQILAMIYLATLFPETLPPERRKFTVNLRSFMPWDTLPILWRTDLIRRLSALTALSAFIDQVTTRGMPLYFQLRMNWAASNAYVFEMCYDISIIVWFTLIFGYFVHALGELGALAFCRAASIFYVIPAVAMVVQPWMAFVNISLWAGPMSFALPAVAGLKSRLVGESEQGRMQAALSTVYTVSGSLGQVVFGVYFNALAEEKAVSKLGSAMVVSNVLPAAICFLMLYDLTKRARSLYLPRKQGDLEGGAAAAAEDKLLEGSPEASNQKDDTKGYGSMD